MHRDQYLGNISPTTTSHTVRDFVVWLAENLGNPSLFTHEYTDRRSGTAWQCQGLKDACAKYQWSHKGVRGVLPGTNLESNNAALSALGNALHDSLSPANDPAAFTAAADVMKWGGVQAGNVRWLSINTDQLASLLKSTATAFTNGNLSDPLLLNKDLRFNAGMTKVYSLLVEDFIIYDSRVGAALGWIVAKYCEEKKLPGVPAEIAFPWAPSKEAPNAKSPKNRNPGRGAFCFPRLVAGPQHAHWNLKASWILAEVLALAGADGFAGPKTVAPLRRLEAALFMIGYDLPKYGSGMTETMTAPSNAPNSLEGGIECYTAVHRNQFYYHIDESGIRLEDGRYYPIAVINKMLTALWEVFGTAPFPLANSATKVRADEGSFGLGKAYYEACERKGNPPDSSALAATLQDIGVLTFTPGKKANWSINASEFSLVRVGSPIDITPLIKRELELREIL